MGSGDRPAPTELGASDRVAPKELTRAHRELYRGMLQADTALLGDLLDDDYTLTHLTGYVQPKKQWLEQIDSGDARYHSVQPHSVTIAIEGDRAVLIGRDVVDATFGGERGTWNLQFTTDYERRSADWIALRTIGGAFETN